MRDPLQRKINVAAFWRKLHSIAENIYNDLPKLHIIANIIIVKTPFNMAVVMQSFVMALLTYQRVDLFQQFGNGKFFVLQRHPSRFNPGHIQDIIDKA